MAKSRKRGAAAGRFAGRWILLVPLVIVIIVAVVSLVYYTPLRIWYREARQVRVLEEQLAAIREHNEQLKQAITSLETTEGIKAYARESLDLVDQGENLVVVLRDGQPITEQTASEKQLAIARIPYVAQPFGAWTPFLDTLFRVELPSAGF